jgi:hypothetical protein
MRPGLRVTIAVVIAVIVASALLAPKFFPSCLSRARNLSRLTLTGGARVASCVNTFMRTDIIVRLDSSAASVADAEAARLPLLRIEDISVTESQGSLRRLIGHHGWYRSNLGEGVSASATVVVLDLTTRSLRVTHYAL